MKKKPEIVLVAGARPNFMKVAPLWRGLQKNKRFRIFLVHTGQHYDPNMSKKHFVDLSLPSPNAYLDVGSGSHAKQTALVMERFEKILLKRRPRLVVVVGDVNSTLAAALTSQKLHIPVAHVEAGLRSYDWEMPEEINRVVADHTSDFLFTYSKEANQNLQKEGISPSKIFFVGNIMIDSLEFALPEAQKRPPLSSKPYGMVTLHRPSNVDHPKTFKKILTALVTISKKLPLFFPIHPRIKNIIHFPKSAQITLLEPLSYIEMIAALSRAKLVLTDSGGIQEETTILGIPCLTLRENSERMITVHQGTNQVVGTDPNKIVSCARRILKKKGYKKYRPQKWDGKTNDRILKILTTHIK